MATVNRVLGTTVLLVLLLLPASVAAASTVLLFRTPTGNIGCVFASGLPGSGPPSVRCDIRSRLRPAPRQPKSCPLDYGDSLSVSQHGRAILVCHGDTAIDPHSRVLAYGHVFRRAGVECTSRSTGLTCTNEDGHGFFLSRQSWRRF